MRATLLLVLLVLMLLPAGIVFAQGDNPDRAEELQEILDKGLKARLPEEFQFIARVVQLVEEKQLPESLVKSVFNWARKKNKRVPFPYFERAMRILAARYGVEIDEEQR